MASPYVPEAEEPDCCSCCFFYFFGFRGDPNEHRARLLVQPHHHGAEANGGTAEQQLNSMTAPLNVSRMSTATTTTTESTDSPRSLASPGPASASSAELLLQDKARRVASGAGGAGESSGRVAASASEALDPWGRRKRPPRKADHAAHHGGAVHGKGKGGTAAKGGKTTQRKAPFVVKNLEECPICLEEFTDDSPATFLKCGHAFHLHCIYEWLERSDTCALCNTPIEGYEEAHYQEEEAYYGEDGYGSD